MRRFCHYGHQRPDKRTRDGLGRLTNHFGLTLADLWKPKSYKQVSPPDAENILANLDRYCGKRFIALPKRHWTVLVDDAAKDDERKQAIAGQLPEVVGRYEAPCPQISEDRRRNDFDLFMSLPDDRVDCDFEFGNLPVIQASKWSRLDLRFLHSFGFLENRISGGHQSSPSLVEAWKDLDRCTSIMRAALTLKKHLSEATAFEAAAMKIHMPANFRPTAARAICNDFGNGGTVLDFSAGYGGRFLGFLGSNCCRYIGIDPNLALRPSFEAMFSWIEVNHETGKTWEMTWRPAEDVDYSDLNGQVDLVFTSPPSFDLERYSDDPTQSSARYQSVAEWLEGFLFGILRRAVPCLTHDGHLVLNLADNPTYGIQIVDRAGCVITKNLEVELIPVHDVELAVA